MELVEGQSQPFLRCQQSVVRFDVASNAFSYVDNKSQAFLMSRSSVERPSPGFSDDITVPPVHALTRSWSRDRLRRHLLTTVASASIAPSSKGAFPEIRPAP